MANTDRAYHQWCDQHRTMHGPCPETITLDASREQADRWYNQMAASRHGHCPTPIGGQPWDMHDVYSATITGNEPLAAALAATSGHVFVAGDTDTEAWCIRCDHRARIWQDNRVFIVAGMPCDAQNPSSTQMDELHSRALDEDKGRRYCAAGGHMLRLCPEDTPDRCMTPIGRKVMLEEAHAEALAGTCGRGWVAEIELCYRCGKPAFEHDNWRRYSNDG